MELILLVIFFGLAIMMLVMGLRASKENKQVQERISELASSSAQSKTMLLRERALEKSFNERVVFPFAQKIFDVSQQFVPLTSKSWVKQKLVQAGYTNPQYPKIFLGIQLLATCVIFGLFFSLTLFFPSFGAAGYAIAIIFGLMGYGMPMLWLMQQAQKRQDSIQKSLPDFIDLLVICVEAGLGLDTAINKIATLQSEKTSSYLQEELIRYTKDVSFGKPRKDALLDMADRTGVEDLNTIINALVQSYEMGSGVAHTLRVQSDSLRVKRLQKAEEKANKIPVKMVMPIYIFLFPAIFVTIFGPIGMVFIESVMEIFQNIESTR